jgi:dTDP-4-dehydrorhamnose reductase
MLGTELSLLLEKSAIPFKGTGREVDIADPAALMGFVKSQAEAFDWIINCAAYTAVDKAEDDKENCRLLNTEGAGNVSKAASRIGAALIHISTDYVFNGKGSRPYTEEDATDPIGVYGLTKRDGELRVLEENTKTYIIRTAWLYGKYGSNFVRTMLRLMREQGEAKVVNDQKGSPTWARDLSETIIALINEAGSKAIPYGIYHYTNEGEITWFDFAKEIHTQARALNLLTNDCKIIPCASSDFPAKVKRPEYSALDNAKIKKTLGIAVPVWNTSLWKFLGE